MTEDRSAAFWALALVFVPLSLVTVGGGQTVVADIHGESSPDELWRAMQGADRYDLMAMAMTLAALTPYDRPSLGQWLREISGLTTKDGSIARGLALLIPQRQAVDVRKLKEPGSARSNRLRADGEGAVCQ